MTRLPKPSDYKTHADYLTATQNAILTAYNARGVPLVGKDVVNIGLGADSEKLYNAKDHGRAQFEAFQDETK